MTDTSKLLKDSGLDKLVIGTVFTKGENVYTVKDVEITAEKIDVLVGVKNLPSQKLWTETFTKALHVRTEKVEAEERKVFVVDTKDVEPAKVDAILEEQKKIVTAVKKRSTKK